MTTRNFNVKNGLTVGTATIDAATGNANVGNLGTAQILATANITSPQLISNVATGTAPFIVTSTTQVANLNVATSGTAGTVTTAAQPNITSVGTLTGLTVNGVTNLGSVSNVIITGGTSGFYLQTNGSGNLTWAAVPTGTGISNGTSNISIPTAGGNVNTSVAGNANILVVTGTGVNVAGTLNATGNANVGNLGATGVVATTLGGSLTTAAQPNITSVGTLSSLTVTGNITGGNLLGPHANGNSNVNIPSANGNVNITAAGNTTLVVTGTGANITGTANVSGNVSGGNFTTAGQLVSTVSTGTAPLVVSSTTAVANLNADLLDGFNTATANTASTVAVRDASGNLSANFFIGNGSQLTGITASQIANISNISNGNSNVNIPAANGNVNISAVGTANVVVVTATGVNVAGTLNATGNANAGNFGTAGQVIATGNVTSSANLVSDTIIGRTGALTIKSAGTNTNINLAPNGTGNIDANGAYITNVKDPSNAQDAATKAYVDNIATTGIAFHTAVNAATTTTLATATGGTITYNNGASGVGANLVTTGSFNLIDTANVQTVGTRILVKDEANAAWNGVYTWANSTTIVRATDADSYGPDSSTDLSVNDYFFVSGGQVNKNTSWIVSAPQGTITFGTSNILFSQFSSIQSYTANTGLTLNPDNSFSISNTTVTAGSYGNGDRVATFTVNSQGQLTAASNVAITANAANLTGTTLNATIVNSSLTSVGTLGSLAVTGNATAGNFVGTLANGNSNVTITANGNVTINAVGGARITATSTGANVTGTLGVSGNANVGNLGAAQVLATANVTAPQFVSNVATGTAPLTVQSTTLVANLNADLLDGLNSTTANTASTIVARDANGNVSANFFIGNGSQLTGITASQVSGIANGNSNVNIPAANGNVNISAVGNANVVVITGTGVNVAGTLNATGNANVGNIGATTAVITTGNITTINSGLLQNGTSNVTIASGANVSTFIGGNATAQFVVTSTGVNVAGTLNAVGNANTGNLGTTTLVATTGNITTVNGNVANATTVIANGTNGTVFANSHTASGAMSGNLNVATVTGNLGIRALASTYTDNVAAAGTVANAAVHALAIPTLAASNAITTTNAATFYIAGAPTAGTNVSITNGYALYVGAGNSLFTSNVTAGNLNTGGALSVTGNANVGNIGAAAGVFTANVTAGNVYANSGTIGASLLTGTLTTASQPNVTSLGTLSSLAVTGNITTGNVRLNGGLTSNRSNVSVATNTVIDQFAPATFRTAKYIISASGDNGFQSIETLLVHDGVDAYITIYGSISSNVSSEIVNLSANINGVSGNVSLYASNIGANVRVNVVSSYIQI